MEVQPGLIAEGEPTGQSASPSITATGADDPALASSGTQLTREDVQLLLNAVQVVLLAVLIHMEATR